ncbi:MAG: carboxypeptidase regulatory-like domain-containing protein, partial [Clostridia bacterium]|nr:carboxypeptidase regulatory-like domain-containing protein [Clostridia bacterium]
VAIGAQILGSLSGKAFEDMNNNGLMDEGEPGAEGVVIHLEGSRTGVKRDLTTDATGEYCFDRLPDDLYTISATLPQGMLYARYSKTGGDLRSIFTGSNITREFSVKSAAHVTNRNIGVVQKGVIHGTAFLDLNYNGVMDEGEPGYKGVTVEAIKLSNNDSAGKAVTGEDGAFRLENLRGGDYRLRAILPDDGSIFSVTIEGAAHEGNLFAQRNTRRENSVQPLNIASGGEANALIGVARGASVAGTVYQDTDYNGKLNGKEKSLSGIRVRLVNEAGEAVAETTTNNKGLYKLTGIMPGTYQLEVRRKGDFGFTRLRPQEKGGSHIAALVGDWGVSNPMEIAMAEEITGVNACMLPAATVSGSFFHDANDNGLWDEGEPGMVNAQVRLTSEDGEIDLRQAPADDGSYFFDGVMPGKYTLTYILPEHCEMAKTVKDGNTVKHDGQETVTKTFTVAMGEEHQRDLAGAVTLGSFEGVAFCDSNANGALDSTENTLAGASITLSSGSQSESVVTAIDGAFSLTGLRPGEYTLTLVLPDGYIFSGVIGDLTLDNARQAALACPWQQLVDRKDKLLGAVVPASIHGEIWMDENQDGVQAESEWIMEGVALSLVNEATDQVVDTAVSGADGFLFENVRPAVYTVRFDLPEQSTTANASSSTFFQKGMAMVQNNVAISEGENLTGLTTGLVSRTSIGGVAWLDEDGKRSPVAGVTVTLLKGGQPMEQAVTGEDGSYRFDGLWPGEYALTASLPSGMIFVRPDDPDYETGASVIADAETGGSAVLRLLMAQHQLDRDVLYIKPAKVGDLVWLDENHNGLLDGSEQRLPGVSIRLVQSGETVYETTSDASGYYLFSHVYPGEYVLEASAYDQLQITTIVESLRIISSCLTEGDGSNASSDPFRVESGTTNANCDLGYILPEGETLPAEALQPAPGRDWTIPNTPKEK